MSRACYSMTLNLDLAAYQRNQKRRDQALFNTMICLLISTVNKHKEFFSAIDTNGYIGIFGLLHSSYKIFQKDKINS